MLPGLAWPGPGHGLAIAWPGHGQVAIDTKQGAALGCLGFLVPMALESLGFPDLRHWLSPQRVRPWPGHGQVLARPDQATYL